MHRHLSCLLALLIGMVTTHPAAAQDDQYKRFAQDAVVQILEGDVQAAVDDLQGYLARFPDDPEFYHALAAASTRQGQLDEAFEYAQRAVAAGLPPGRFLSGPDELFGPLLESESFRRWVAELDVDLVHGPLLGSVTARGARFWVRTAAEVPVGVTVFKNGSIVAGRAGRTRADRDMTRNLSVDGLEPDTPYRYSLTVDGRFAGTWTFTTMPEEERPTRFRVAFGGGAGYTPWHERIWTTIDRRDPTAFLMMGDNAYIDHPTRRAVQDYTYYRRQSSPAFRALVAETPVYAIWDDHDFGENDSWGGSETFEPAWKPNVWRVFRQNWNNPAYGGGPNQPGVWYDFSIGDVDFFMLDGRYYRTDPKVDRPSMLGEGQKTWLFDRLRASQATFKVLVSPVPWAFGAKGGTQMTPEGPQPGGLDTWEGFPEEREEIFSFLEENAIEGVILLSADRHRSDAWKIDRPEGYDLYEFESSRLTNVHTHPIMEGSLFGYNATPSFGLLTFDTLSEKPAVTYEIMTIDGDVVGSITVARSELGYGE